VKNGNFTVKNAVSSGKMVFLGNFCLKTGIFRDF
jgi:hypothetical protein